MTVLGEPVGDGVRAVVYRIDGNRVVKLAKPATSSDWIRYEARYGEAVHQCGAPSPGGTCIIEIGGEAGLVTDYISGPTLWSELVEAPERADELGRLLADVQQEVFRTRSTFALPSISDRLRAKLAKVGSTFGLDVEPMSSWLDRPGPHGLCHGDLHPYNLILSGAGPVLVDWFDVGIGVATAEIARTAVLLSERQGEPAIEALADSYLRAARTSANFVDEDFTHWVLVQRTARLSEGFGIESLAAIRDQVAGTVWG